MRFVILPSLLGVLTIPAEPKRLVLAPRGYELLPNERWLEEIEKDGGGFLPSLDITASPPAFEDRQGMPIHLALDFETLVASRPGLDSWSDASALAGGFLFERDTNEKFQYEDKYRRMRKILGYAFGAAFSLLPQPRRR